MKYFVLNGHTLGYVLPTDNDEFGILHASVLRGSPYGRLDGCTSLSIHDVLRPATEQDFADYRVNLPPDFASTQRAIPVTMTYEDGWNARIDSPGMKLPREASSTANFIQGYRDCNSWINKETANAIAERRNPAAAPRM
jgi:hypothetical protein